MHSGQSNLATDHSNDLTPQLDAWSTTTTTTTITQLEALQTHGASPTRNSSSRVPRTRSMACSSLRAAPDCWAGQCNTISD